MIFPWLFRFFRIPWFFHVWNFFLVIFKVFHDFQSLWEPCIMLYVVINKGTDQTVWMSMLVCAFVGHMQQSQVFSQQGTYDTI